MKSLFQSMTTRVFVILLAGMAAATLLTIGLSMSERQRMIGEFRDFHAVERVAQFVLTVETVKPELRDPFLAASSGIGMHAEIADASDAPLAQRSELGSRLAKRLGDTHQVVSTATRATDCPAPRSRPPRKEGTDTRPNCEALLITLKDGERLRMSMSPPRPPPFEIHGDVTFYAALFTLSIAILAALVARMTMRPLKRLAQAAMALGSDIARPPLPERGATEIRQAAAAFNAMQSRIQHHIQQRAHILAAITHDLQTPLTRLRLRLEKVDDNELRNKLIGDLSAMQGMVKEGLDLARSMDSAEPSQLLDLDSLIDSVCTDATDAGQSVTVEGKTLTSLRARPLALRRCLTNLIDNAVKYGQFARVTASRDGTLAVIRIRDGGPGIPEAEWEKVFEPFYRLESSRSRQTGGTGLGLTIARNIAEQHGGRILLANVPGGFEVTLELPVQR
jgi:signal transduction histidine kinase